MIFSPVEGKDINATAYVVQADKSLYPAVGAPLPKPAVSASIVGASAVNATANAPEVIATVKVKFLFCIENIFM